MKDEAENCAAAFNLDVSSNPNSTVLIKYSHETNPPTYGDFFIILMVARFISLNGFRVSFIIDDQIRSEGVWSYLNPDQQDSFVLDQITLARQYLNANCEILVTGKFCHESSASTPIIDSNTENVIDAFPQTLFHWSPYLLELLINTYSWKIPDKFLLSSEKPLMNEPYIAWNVRKSVWARYRDTSARSLKRDFAALREIFPNHSIVILSNKDGLSFAFKELANLEPPEPFKIGKIQILPQPDDGYIEAISWVLNSDFYFQRNGGGMSVIAIFSYTPYTIFSVEKTSFHEKFRKTNVSPWSTKNQIFKRLYGRKETFPISKCDQ